jgi:hypothetical protein
MMTSNESGNYVSVQLKDISVIPVAYTTVPPISQSFLDILADAFALSARKALDDLMIRRTKYKSQDNKNLNIKI